MEIANGHDGAYEQGDDRRFSGRVWLSPGLAGPEGTGMAVVHFSAGARTNWHRHPGVLLPGDRVYIPPDEWHYHGGGPDSPMAHVAVSMGGPAEWADPVTDQEYDEGF